MENITARTAVMMPVHPTTGITTLPTVVRTTDDSGAPGTTLVAPPRRPGGLTLCGLGKNGTHVPGTHGKGCGLRFLQVRRRKYARRGQIDSRHLLDVLVAYRFLPHFSLTYHGSGRIIPNSRQEATQVIHCLQGENMGTELITQETMFTWARDTIARFNQVDSFDDIERLFLRDRGLSGNTYATYTASVKSAYTFLDGKHPLQWTAPDVEAFYDYERKRNGISTASLRMAGLRNFMQSIKTTLPFWTTPFESMGEATRRKIATPAIPKQKAALYAVEVQAVLHNLRMDKSEKGRWNLAMVLTLFTTGLRAQELCDLSGESLEHDLDTDTWYVKGIGKGRKPFSQELHPDALAALLDVHGGKLPEGTEPLFLSLESFHGKVRTRLTKAVLWTRLHDIGEDMKARNLIRRDVEFSAHLWRRTFLTLLSKEGMSLRAIQAISRHASIETLARHYVDDRESPRPYLDKILTA